MMKEVERLLEKQSISRQLEFYNDKLKTQKHVKKLFKLVENEVLNNLTKIEHLINDEKTIYKTIRRNKSSNEKTIISKIERFGKVFGQDHKIFRLKISGLKHGLYDMIRLGQNNIKLISGYPTTVIEYATQFYKVIELIQHLLRINLAINETITNSVYDRKNMKLVFESASGAEILVIEFEDDLH